MNKEPETYEELIRKKHCIKLTEYYELTKAEVEQIYDFLTVNANGQVRCGYRNIFLVNNNDITNGIIIPSKRLNKNIDGILMSNVLFNIVPHMYFSSLHDIFSSSNDLGI